MTASNKTQNNAEEQELTERDLQLLLRSKLGEQVVVLQSRMSYLPPGDNFACRIAKITASVKRDEDAPEETLHLVAKLYPQAESIKAVFDFRKLFGKEIFCYEKLLPTFKQLASEFGVVEITCSDFAPGVINVRLSADPHAKKIDEGVVLLMENLNTLGYYTLDKIEGSDLNHSRMAIKALARFHALGIACKQHRPDFFQNEVLSVAKVVEFNDDVGNQGNIFDLLCNMMFEDPRIAKYSERIKKLIDLSKTQSFANNVSSGPWLSLAHMDFWTSNVLYRKDEAGHLVDVKFIDFQNYVYQSPLRDLPYFLCTSTSHEVMTRHFDEMLDSYYETFIDVLKQMRCDVAPFTRESFDQQLKIDSSLEFFHNIVAIKFFCAEIDKDSYHPDDLESVVIYSQINALGYDKWYQIILTYIERGWL